MKFIPKKRRQEGKTNYSKRLRLLEGHKPRIVVRKTNKYITIQYIESSAAQDAVIVTVNSKVLLKHAWPADSAGSLKSLGAAYLTGFLFAKKVKGFKPAIADVGLVTSTPGSRIYATLKGINDGGFAVPCGEKVYPSEERIINENIKSFFDKVKKNIMESK
jgi:large subunit ribosomal protein L18